MRKMSNESYFKNGEVNTKKDTLKESQRKPNTKNKKYFK